MARIARFVVVCLLATAFTLLPDAPTVSAGGSWMRPVQDRYDPGESATLVGYTGGGSLGSVDDGPFFGYLFRLPGPDRGPHPRAIPLPVGKLDVSRTGDAGYTANRVAITFELPASLIPGTYWLSYCNEGCEKQLGDLIAGIFHVGIDPEYQQSREWPRSEPEIANMDRSAVIVGPGSEITAGELQMSG